MDSPEWNETHKAPCTPRQRLYQTEINGRQHSLWAPKLQGQIQYLGGLWESLIGLDCVCVCLAFFNQVSQQQTLGVKWCVSGSEAFQAGQKVGEAVGLRAQPSQSVNVSQFSSGAQKAFALPAVKLAAGESLKSQANPALEQPISGCVRDWEQHILYTFIRSWEVHYFHVYMCRLCFVYSAVSKIKLTNVLMKMAKPSNYIAPGYIWRILYHKSSHTVLW